MEDFKNGQTGIISGLDNETVNALKQTQKNFNDEFMNGASTSGFKERSAGENIGGIVKGVSAANNLIDSVITPKLVTYVTSYVTNVVSAYLASSMTEMLSFNPGEVTSMAAGLLKNYIIGPSQIMSELMKTREQMNDEQIEKTQQELFNKINDKIGETVGNVNKEINEKLETINPIIANIAYYSQMGPVWVSSKVDLATQKLVENCIKGITISKEALNKQKEEMMKNIAEGIAGRMAQKANDEVKRSLKDQIDEMNKKKQDAMNKVKAQIINAKLKIYALVGV